MKWIAYAGLVTAALALMSGCLHSRVDENWGNSYEAQTAWQTLDPEAGVGEEAPQGLDPETGFRVADRYYKTQENQRQRQAPTVVIGEIQ